MNATPTRFEHVGDVDNYWAKARELLAPAFNYRVNIFTVDDCYEPLKRDEMQLWLATRDTEIIGAAITTITRGSLGSLCEIISLGGSHLKDWIALVDQQISHFATLQNCIAVEAITRRGFTHYVPDFIEDGRIHVKILRKSHG